jgi:hypothetical protein
MQLWPLRALLQRFGHSAEHRKWPAQRNYPFGEQERVNIFSIADLEQDDILLIRMGLPCGDFSDSSCLLGLEASVAWSDLFRRICESGWYHTSHARC